MLVFVLVFILVFVPAAFIALAILVLPARPLSAFSCSSIIVPGLVPDGKAARTSPIILEASARAAAPAGVLSSFFADRKGVLVVGLIICPNRSGKSLPV